jgi:hypothetical protein
MRISSMKLAVVAALVAAFAMAATTSASADTTSCSTEGSVKLSPGLSEKPHVQNITVKGTLSGCTGEGSSVIEGKYVAHLKTAEAVSCAALKGAGAPDGQTSIVLKWVPHSEGNSNGTFSMPLTEAAPVSLAGTIGKGPFDEDAIAGTVTQTYTDGATCGVGNGHKKAKKVNKGTVSGTLSIS